jgi:hypothetical protein
MELSPTLAPTPPQTAPLERQPRTGPSSRAATVPAVFVALFALLLASFPVRNSDVWAHLAAGRQLAHGAAAAVPAPSAPHSTWLYDLASYAVYSVVGGPGLVLVKALTVVAVALLLLQMSRAGSGWWVAVLCTALALLAMGTRLLLQPTTASYLFLALAIWFARSRDAEGRSWLPAWPLALLFVTWANTSGWFTLGLAVVALVWLGQALDETLPGAERRAVLRRRAVALLVLCGLCLLNPAGVAAFAPPAELGWFGAAGPARAITSPFQRAYLTTFAQVPAALAYFPLLGLGALSFALALPRWSWQRFLPFAALAVLSGTQARAIPFFAVVAGPALAWNLHEFFARRPAAERAALPRRWRFASGGVQALLGLAFLACAWPGWLQGAPFEPRRWDIDTPPALADGAGVVRQWHEAGKLDPAARGLHLSPESAQTFAWFCPQDRPVQDRQLAADILDVENAPADWPARLRAAGINHVVVYDPNPDRLFAALVRLLGNPHRWPLLHVAGDLAVFGWRDPDAASDTFAGWGVDLDRLAFHTPGSALTAEHRSDPERAPRRWWHAFWKRAPAHPIGRAEARFYLLEAEVARRSAAVRHQTAWESAQAAALTAAAAGWASGPGALLDANVRLELFRPSLPAPPAPPEAYTKLPPLTQAALVARQRDALRRDDTPPAILYLAVRAARRAVAANPDDSRAYLMLAESYLGLLGQTRERAWGARLQELVQLRRIQTSWALNQAIRLEPTLATPHLQLAQLYRDQGYWDLSLQHARQYTHLARQAGPPPGVPADAFRGQLAQSEATLQKLAQLVDERRAEYAAEAPKMRVADRAAMAMGKGLAGTARDVLLASDIAAFGPRGMELELKLLLLTGRARDVWDWTVPEQQASLGATYYWIRALAGAALGDYDAARSVCAELAPTGGQRPSDAIYRERLAQTVGQFFADELAAGATRPNPFERVIAQSGFGERLTNVTRHMRQEVDVTVLRGLLALEQGETAEAVAAFRAALACWSDEPERGRLDFRSRVIAQDWLETLTAR